MAKREQVALRLTGELGELFDRCRQHIVEAKRNAGLDTATSVSEVLRNALLCLDEKHNRTSGARQPKRAV